MASTNILRHLIKLSVLPENQTAIDEIDQLAVHNKTFTHPHLRPLYAYSEQDAKHILETYRKVTFVRNPLDRLVSAWYHHLYKFHEDFYLDVRFISYFQYIIFLFVS